MRIKPGMGVSQPRTSQHAYTLRRAGRLTRIQPHLELTKGQVVRMAITHEETMLRLFRARPSAAPCRVMYTGNGGCIHDPTSCNIPSMEYRRGSGTASIRYAGQGKAQDRLTCSRHGSLPPDPPDSPSRLRYDLDLLGLLPLGKICIMTPCPASLAHLARGLGSVLVTGAVFSPPSHLL